MKVTLRSRIILTLVPLLTLLAVLGGAGYLLLSHLSRSIDVILRDNYDSVLYMQGLGEAVERIDSSFTFTLSGEEALARKQYSKYWRLYKDNLNKEANNITLPGEAEKVAELTALTKTYRGEGDAFYAAGLPGPVASSLGLVGSPSGQGPLLAAPALMAGIAHGAEVRHKSYFGTKDRRGLLQRFTEIKTVAGKILRLNQENIENASAAARATAASSLVWFGGGLAVAGALAALLAMRMVRDILRPLRSVTESANAIGAGNLDQVIAVVSNDELGQLAEAFNLMARQLRDYRRSHQARILRLQQTTQATINAFPHPVLVVDGEGRVQMANPAARRLLGVGADSEHVSLAWVPPEPLRGPLADALAGRRDYLPEGFNETFALRMADREHSFLPRVLTIRDPQGHVLGAAILLEDVTRFRLLDQVKSNLVATVSHELKTPLTGIRLAVHLLLEETVGSLTPKQLELLLDARDNTERLLAMIENLLDLARLESRGERLELRPEQPEDLLRHVAEEFRPRAEDKGVQLALDFSPDLPPVAADAAQVGRALHNLLDNALRYTPRGGRVKLGASTANGEVTFTVSDNGPGIPSQYLPRVFERFFRVPGQSHGGGTGLGLAIVREVATAHGGIATCESKPGEGTIFRVKLPIWKG